MLISLVFLLNQGIIPADNLTHNMNNKFDNLKNTGGWIGVGTAIGAAVFAATNEPTWIAVGVAVGAAFSWKKPKK